VLRVGLILGATALAGALAAPAPMTDQATSFQGTFAGPITYTACTTDPGNHLASGTWRVHIQQKKANARFLIEVDGVPHVAFTAQMVVEQAADGGFVVSTDTLAGRLTVILKGRDFAYAISPYAYAGLDCASVVYPGSLTS